MYRRSIDYSPQSAIHVVEFSSFRRKNEPITQLTIEDEGNKVFKIAKGSNTIMCIIIIADLLNDTRHRGRKSTGKIFQDFAIENVPKSQFGYQHQNTLEQIWSIISSKSKSISAVQDCLTNYTVVEFAMMCYARKIIRDYIEPVKQNQGSLDLFGNQIDVLMDYNSEIRGNLLNYLALALKLGVSVKYQDAGSHLEDSFTEYYGDRNALNKVQIESQGDCYIVSLHFNEQLSKLISIHSTSTIQQSRRKQKQQQSLDTTMEGQSTRQTESHSQNKTQIQARCLKCKGRNCQCDRVNKKATPKLVLEKTTSNTNTVSNKSLFDGVVSSATRRHIISHDTNLKACTVCGKVACTCKK